VRRSAALLILLLVGPALAGCGSSKHGRAELAFVSTRDGDYALFAVDPKGREWRIAHEQGDPATPAGLYFELEPAWSPDGASIAFTSKRDRYSHVFLMRADGTGVRRLTSGSHDDSNPAWSPDGREIAVGRGGALFAVSASTGAAHRITGPLPGDAEDPSYSPDGKRIAFDYRRPGFRSREIWIVDADGAHPHPITSLNHTSAAPTWSPDGRRVAFESNARNGTFAIYTVGADGTHLRRDTSSSIDTIDPAWSPDGTSIAFSRDGAIWTIDGAGTEKQLSSGGNDAGPAWAPATS
jgi:TolB protein